ncbi:MAG: hypothetical protein ABS81_14150 [Pseudonocardia sp. SCN 72-86]|nr:MAG: hypothetical protein ABS81_14150 [Pseudonocardia sp. SCN 72-86]
MRAYVQQVVVTDDEPAADRAARVLDTVRGFPDPELVVLPELWLHGGFNYDGWGDGIDLDHPVLADLAAVAAEKRCVLHAGSVVLRDRAGRPTNTALVYGPDGRLAARYDKIHLFGFDEGEAVTFAPGTETVVVPTADAVLGMSICFDLRFPELFRRLLDQYADVITVPAAWPDARAEHWRVLLRARAIESQAWVCAASTAGTHSGLTMSGYSAIVSPAGEVVAEAGPDEEATLVVDLDLELQRRLRAEFPVLEWRRLDRPAH